ncbi:methionine sulfoxide reductase B [Croceibacterium mercuriale]|uniref:Peptide methionine sulfoxide reductase MsrB n=1 Tax=Croceibacterium mercuriale TaxID=1572751 RepID=A0A0B2BY70_9SPHN|nr:peptide-methionine (R)-S-oxide reductase MsrB [Croceibacterium mercuriale]KHL26394.1 methionine sulfoxide reductase B [Croceibacterium mercuriale]
MADKLSLDDVEWRERLSPEQYQVLRRGGTERAFTGKYDRNRQAGEYRCAGCGQALFASGDKYESGSGWPSFRQPVADAAVEVRPDATHGMVRTEVVCTRCDGHLGHVFPDGPDPDDLRYCINSASLAFRPVD